MSTPTFHELIAKYNVSAPRYTSYPTVPTWQLDTWSEEAYLTKVRKALDLDGSGIALYIHLPFCESLCTYCGCNTRITKNHQVEDPYLQAVIKEWQMFKSRVGRAHIPIKELHLGGGTPTFFQPDKLKFLIEQLLGDQPLLPDAAFSFEAHPANTRKAHLEALYEVGFRRLSLGIQDFDSEVQKIINRHQTEADVWRVMEEARTIGYQSINFDLIYGLPLQTADGVASTIRKTLALKPDRISFYSYAHVPWIKPSQRLFTEDMLPAGAAKLALYELGKEMILASGYQDVGMDHFALPGDALLQSSLDGTLHRNFMGYTDQHSRLLVGLGVSSISDAWEGYAQNEKTVEGYYARIHAGELPYVKGHILDEVDVKVRRMILDIMCKGSTTLALDSKLFQEIYPRLQPLFTDGLLIQEGEKLQVTSLGKSFLRNICMAFDQRMFRAKQEQLKFSQAV